jgi:hypothetical protein
MHIPGAAGLALSTARARREGAGSARYPERSAGDAWTEYLAPESSACPGGEDRKAPRAEQEQTDALVWSTLMAGSLKRPPEECPSSSSARASMTASTAPHEVQILSVSLRRADVARLDRMPTSARVAPFVSFSGGMFDVADPPPRNPGQQWNQAPIVTKSATTNVSVPTPSAVASFVPLSAGIAAADVAASASVDAARKPR